MRLAPLFPIIILAVAPAVFGGSSPGLPDFSGLSLDELANIKVTSFTSKEQKLSQVAGAVYVINQEQIARSGLTSVPELLRLVPGVEVAQVNGNQWSVSVRGSIGVYSNKLLVLIDGRSVYSPVFSGVYWDMGMPLLENIERIEVIRGPGATIWGANAVLGVINIITKSSKDTHGTTITSGVGSSERGFGSASVGGAVGSTNYRVYFGGSDHDALSQLSGVSAGDGWSSVQGGFRLDGSHGKDIWMLEGSLFRAPENGTGIAPSLATQSLAANPYRITAVAADLTGEWRRRVGETGEFRLSSWFDYADRPQPVAYEAETRTWDGEAQYDFTAGRHSISVGGGERVIATAIRSDGEIVFSPQDSTYADLNAFAQDEIHFAHDAVLVTLGAKLEHVHFSGWGQEPSANLLWTPRKHHSFWISAARALRTPSLFEVDVSDPYNFQPASAATAGLPVLSSLVGSAAYLPESVRDFEAGYRGQISNVFSVDLALFYDQISNLRSFTSENPVLMLSPAPYLSVPVVAGNSAAATGRGAESSIVWQVFKDWKVEGSYTYNITGSWVAASAPAGSMVGDGIQPARNNWRLQSYLNLSKSWKLDTFLYRTGTVGAVNTYQPGLPVPSYSRLDVRLGYRTGPHWQLSLAGQNLLQARHLEGEPELLTAASYVKRGVYLKSTWQF
jgi:iron complex outermembrane receptor protein